MKSSTKVMSANSTVSSVKSVFAFFRCVPHFADQLIMTKNKMETMPGHKLLLLRIEIWSFVWFLSVDRICKGYHWHASRFCRSGSTGDHKTSRRKDIVQCLPWLVFKVHPRIQPHLACLTTLNVPWERKQVYLTDMLGGNKTLRFLGNINNLIIKLMDVPFKFNLESKLVWTEFEKLRIGKK